MSSFIGNNSSGSSSSGGSETLKQTLALGNVTDGYNIQISTNDKIIGQTDLVFNVPTASTYIFKINNTNEVVFNSTTIDLQNNALTTTGAGTLNSLTLSSLGLGVAHLSSGGIFSSSLLVDADVSASAAIAGTKVSPSFGSQAILTSGTLGAGATTATSLTVSGLSTGIGHLGSGGALTSSLIVNADVNAAAAIAGSKVSPDFGAQDITTSGNQTITGATGFLALRTTPATAGSIRLSNNSGIFTRNAGDTANVRTAMVDTSNILQIGDTNNAGIVANCATGTSLSLQVNSVEKLNVSVTKTTVAALAVSALGTGIGHLDSSGNLTSSTLVDADVNAAAAIAGSKVSPTFGSQNILTTGVASLGSTPASAGVLRLGNALDINFRNAANNADVRGIGVDSSNNVLIGNTSAANTIFDLATSGVYTFKINGGTELTLNATTLDLQNNAITTTGAGTVNSLTVSSLGTGIGHYSSGGALTSSLIVAADINASAAILKTQLAAAVQTTLSLADTSLQPSGFLTQIALTGFYSLLFGPGGTADPAISSGTTTISADTNYDALTISGTGIFVPNAIIRVKGRLKLTGASAVIKRNGAAGNAGAAGGTGGVAASGSAPVAGAILGGTFASIVGGAGGTAAGTTAGAATAQAGFGGPGGTSPTAGSGSGGAGGAGKVGGVVVGPGISTLQALLLAPPIFCNSNSSTIQSNLGGTAGGSGGGGGGDGTSGGGGGSAGVGGAPIWIYCAEFETDGTTAASAIQSIGGAGAIGGTPAAGNRGGGAPGGGGGGGPIYIVVGKRIGSAVTNLIDASGGAGATGGSGTGTGTGSPGSNGGDGGRIVIIDLSAGTITTVAPTTGGTGNANSGTTGGTGGAGGSTKVTY